MQVFLIIIISLLAFSCNSQENNVSISKMGQSPVHQELQESESIKFNSQGNTIEKRFLVSGSLKRIPVGEGTFAQYLRSLPLKPHGSKVKKYNDELKYDQSVAAAVVNLPIGKRDLHQCADGIMHLKARYHFDRKEYDKIGFHFVNGFYCDFEHWKNGYRVRVSGNKTNWYKSGNKDSSQLTFWKYLEMVFSYAGTLSLAKELQPVSLNEIQIGDVFIIGGSPGHAIVVVDMSINENTGEKFLLLAQSYMPAQELHVLANFDNADISPWYSLSQFDKWVSTPEWTFEREDLKRFPN
ncbi:MAG: hypothetical protein CL840_08880 [Crocinitomicaceae bacterium]|nr:hypothetical protein [Crocinitomicaceae bacterium]|tara:strand:+ start:71718 stop:72605 length:888 start_codon:yes stop_codon:yes gene_type:complete